MLFRWRDDPTWKRFVPLAQEGDLDQIRDALADYSLFAAYHGCRPHDPNVYYQHGLQIADVDALNRRADEIFLSSEFPGVTKAKLLECMNQNSSIHDGKVFVVLDDERFMEASAHYLIYGSEHLWRLANCLSGRGMVNSDVLKRFGIPTLFEIHIPSHELQQDQLNDLPKQIRFACGDRDLDECPPLGLSLVFQRPLPGSWIKRHVHPEEILDRTRGFPSVYRYKDGADRVPA